MRKIWITCGWVLYGAGVFLVVTMGLAWLGEGKPSKIIPSIVMGCLFIFLGHNFVARGRSSPIYTTSQESEASRNDQLAVRRMIIQAIWIGGVILLAVALVVGLWILFISPCNARSVPYFQCRTTIKPYSMRVSLFASKGAHGRI
jgi:hypothetical protein